MLSGSTIDTAAVLVAARRARAVADAAGGAGLGQGLAWGRARLGDDGGPGATGGGSPVRLAGAGAPQVSQFAVVEFGACVGMSRRSAEHLFADVLELAYRLPRTWSETRAGRVRSWRARQVAQATQELSPQAAGYVDEQVAWC